MTFFTRQCMALLQCKAFAGLVDSLNLTIKWIKCAKNESVREKMTKSQVCQKRRKPNIDRILDQKDDIILKIKYLSWKFYQIFQFLLLGSKMGLQN